MQSIPEEDKSDFMIRLRRIEGQVRGVQRMLDADRDCYEVLQQLSAARSALQNVSLIIARRYALQCMNDRESGLTTEQLVEQLLAVLSKV